MFIPLLYQLISAYQPSSPTNISYQRIFTSTSYHQVLGISNTIIPTHSVKPPVNIGGEESSTVSIALIGDSMIQTLGVEVPQLRLSLSKYYPKIFFDLYNFGVSSTTLEMAKNRLDEVIASQPDIVVIESFAYNNFGNTQSGFDRQWLALGAITTTLKEKLPDTKIILATTIAPNSIVYGNGIKDLQLTAYDKIERTKTIKLYLQNLINFSKSQGFLLADSYNLSLHQNEGLLELISSSDHLHPSRLGHELFCDTLADTIFQNKLVNLPDSISSQILPGTPNP